MAIRKELLTKVVYVFYDISLVSTLFFFGAAIITAFVDPMHTYFCINAVVTVTLALIAWYCGRYLFLKEGKLFIFKSVFFILLVLFTILGCELVARSFVPSWPAVGLHGVNLKDGLSAWDEITSSQGPIEFNSWGQRDFERKNKPVNGAYRIAFVGDSIVEGWTPTPVSIATEHILQNNSLEIINLGIYATDPDEYYYRAKNIGMKLGISHCFLFFYTGNDFISKRSMRSVLGIIAVYPRDSFFSTLHLTALNHILTNRWRPLNVRQRWGEETQRHRGDTKGRTIAQTDDQAMPSLLIDMFGSGMKDTDAEYLRKLSSENKLGSFFEMLRNPDEGLFRPGYLSYALRRAAGVKKKIYKKRVVPVSYAYDWLSKFHKLCQKKEVGFTLVIVPEAFQVDDRMRRGWMPLVDMAWLFEHTRDSTERLLLLARADNMNIIDLHGPLENLPGTYLNPDGHWSSYGVDVVAKVLADYISKEIDFPSNQE
jgi:hypothetical protein